MATQSSDYTYSSAQSATIPATVEILQLQDRDHSFWRRSATQPAHAGKFQSGDGAWWELMNDQVITPAMFGCSSSIPDNSTGLTNFYTYLETFECVANHDGLFPVRNGVIMGTATVNDDNAKNNCSIIQGRITLVVGAPIAGAVLRNRMKRGTKIEGIVISPDPATGGASLVYASKIFDIGLLFEGSAQMQNIDFISVAYARICGVLLNGIAPNNVFANRFGTGYIYGCGSGVENDGTPAATDANFLSSAYSGFGREGASAGNDLDIYQFTLFNVATLPPQIVTDRGLVSFVRVGNDEYPVADIIRTPGAFQVRVWGWVPTSVAASGTLRFVFGGGLHSVGGDAGVQIGSMAITACAIGNHNGALYPGHFDLTLQHNYIGQVVGTSPANASVGGSLRGYFEGNTADIWYLVSDNRDYSYRVLADQALSLLRVKFHSSKRTPDSARYRTKPKGLNLSFRGRDHGVFQEPDFEGQFNSHLCTFQVEPRVTALRAGANGTEWIAANQCQILLENWNQGSDGGTTPADFNRLFGYRSQYYLCTGHGANGAPGSIHIRRGNNTINGAASDLVITDLAGPALLLIERDPNSQSNMLIHVVAGKAGSGGLSNDSVTNAYLVDMAQATIKGRGAGAGTGDPQDLTPAQARSVIASDSGNGGLFLAGDGTFKAPPAGASWTIDYVAHRGSYYNLTPANMTHRVFNTSADGFHRVFLQNLATGTRVKLTRLRGGQPVEISTTDPGQTLSRRTGTGNNPEILEGGTVFLTKVADNLWVGEGDFAS
jgi:hypothetical protein